MKRLLEWVLALLIFLIPSNLFFKFLLETGYVRGIFVDYLLPKIYLSQLVVLVFVILTVWMQRSTFKSASVSKKLRTPVVLIIVVSTLLLLIRQLFTENPVGAFFQVFQLLVTFLFGWALYQNRSLLQSKIVAFSFVVTLLFQSLLGLYQFLQQKSLIGYWFLGEIDISQPLGVVRQQLLDREMALPYGTTAHPNILGGVLAIYLIVCSLYWLREKKPWSAFSSAFYCAVAIALVVLFLTQSLTAWLVVGGGIGILFCEYQKLGGKKAHLPFRLSTLSVQKFLVVLVIAAVSIPLVLSGANRSMPELPSVERRVLLNQAALRMLAENTFFGVGLNQFTIRVEEYGQLNEVVRFMQPVHHIGLLWLAETGLLGALLLGMLAFSAHRNTIRIPTLFLILVPILFLDHYLLSLQTGLLLLVIGTVSFSYLSDREVKQPPIRLFAT